ncbi:hypothetical protein M199_gp189 [Halogranum tailed virus 1]|uniref:Uncharacterized protein n=1 Tax=Halogranum tailed virus 1 TaxID=1273749 RepID=R4TLC0_9CAUD|nr:hypothetical protein M199_gp189 [Halogranum tailed virus 1]AGM11477.1 hypothetical protein HGTV1_180 [Halogranum tailed virus 1]
MSMSENQDSESEYEPEKEPEAYEDMALSVCVNGKVYRLSDEFKSDIERIAENEYGDNEFFSYHWRVADSDDEDHEAGDAILCIETEGHMVPWDALSEFELEMQERGPQVVDPSSDDDQQPTERDNGNGVKTVKKDEVGMDDDTPDDMQDFKMTMMPQNFRPIPDPDDGKFSTLPPEPQEYDEEAGPILVIPIPQNQREERWAAGRSMVPVYNFIEWNMQKRADSVPSFGQKKRGDSHDKWQDWLERQDCEVTGTLQPKNPPEEQDDSAQDMYDSQEDVGPKYGGNNWQV